MNLKKLMTCAFITTVFFGTAFGVSLEVFACGPQKAEAKPSGGNEESAAAGFQFPGQVFAHGSDPLANFGRSPASTTDLSQLSTPELASMTRSGSEPSWQVDRYTSPAPASRGALLNDKVTPVQTEGIAPSIRGTYYKQ